MKPAPKSKVEFIAKTVADLGKGAVLLALASNFFEKFPFSLGIAISSLSFILIVIGILLFPEGGEA